MPRGLDCVRRAQQQKSGSVVAAFEEGKSRFLSADRQASLRSE
jgi:hypothetical protein